MSDLDAALQSAAAAGHILPESLANARALLASSPGPVAPAAIAELVAAGEWREIDDRFYQRMAFGTGGLRGRTVGRVVTAAEKGSASKRARPQHPCVGTATMNGFNLSRATQGLVAYIKADLAQLGLSRRPHIVIAHDTRHFSKEFTAEAARIASQLGCAVSIFDGPRPTPIMSFAVRQLRADAGIMITASHNPPHDNGYKVNYRDGAGIIGSHASGIIAQVNLVSSESFTPVPPDQQGPVQTLGPEMDQAYLDRVRSLMLRPDALSQAAGFQVVFTALHGTGSVFCPKLLRDLGFTTHTVPEQDSPDGDFPTVESPNPENAAALDLGIQLASKLGADLVIGTDPDADRMGVVARGKDGALHLLTGNQIGSLLAWYRLRSLFDLGILDSSNADRAVLIKTFVTTDLQAAIARRFGVQCLNTLTGFKYISAKLEKYERALPPDIAAQYRDLSEEDSRLARLAHSKYFVFGGEESYGYLGADFTRDKDANGAVVMFAELAAYARSLGLTVIELLDEIYQKYGYYLEINKSKSFEGAEGAAKIARLADSYAASPPAEVDGATVDLLRDFKNGTHHDEEGEPIPKEKMLFVELADGRAFAVRPSGTEPKIKYYLYSRHPAPEVGLTPEQLTQTKRAARESLDSLWAWIQKDVDARLA